MLAPTQKSPAMSDAEIETRRLELLDHLVENEHPLAIFYQLQTASHVAFTLGDRTLDAIVNGLHVRHRIQVESSALATVHLAAQTPDRQNFVYQVVSFQFEHLGTETAVITDRTMLGRGEIEVHTHLFHTPDYLGQTDVGDLIASIEGPAFINPTTGLMNPALRIFGVLSIYRDRHAELQFYAHDLRDALTRANNYGLKRLGNAVRIDRAY